MNLPLDSTHAAYIVLSDHMTRPRPLPPRLLRSASYVWVIPLIHYYSIISLMHKSKTLKTYDFFVKFYQIRSSKISKIYSNNYFSFQTIASNNCWLSFY